MFIEADRFCCVEVSTEEDQTRTKKEINAILSLASLHVYTIVDDARSLNGVVFNCLPVKVKSTDGVVLDIIFFKKNEKEEEEWKDKRDK